MLIKSHTIDVALRAANNPHLLDTADLLAEAAETWRERELLGIDTEFVRERTYRADLGLVQISDGTSAWLVDAVRVRDLAPLRDLFNDPAIMKVFHSASEDLEVLWNTLNVTPTPMMDTQIACAMLGQPLQMSYHHAVKWMSGIEVDKEQTRSNWLHRPLTPGQLHYAATDVVFLPAMYQYLSEDLRQRDRWSWLTEEVDRMCKTSKSGTDYEQAWLRINGCHKLDLRSAQALKALAAWREQTASERNRARAFVVPDAVLLQVAVQRPATIDDLRSITGLSAKALDGLQEPIMRALEQSREQTAPLEQQPPLDSRQRQLIDQLRDAVQDKATELELDPALLASRKQLEALLRAMIAGKPAPERLTGWRQPIITERLLNLATDTHSG